MRALIALSLLLALTAAARDRVPAAVAAGPALQCIPLALIRETRVRDDRTIDWYTNGRQVYRTVLRDPCPELGFEQRIAYETSLSQLCANDIITVLHATPPYRGASCGLAPFQPVTLEKGQGVRRP